MRADAFAEITSWDSYAPTAAVMTCRMLPNGIWGVRRVVFKDESTRFGLGSFKALGGAYSVRRHLSKQTEAAGWGQRRCHLVVATATDGNHGRSVSWGASARRLQAAKIYIHANMSARRAKRR